MLTTIAFSTDTERASRLTPPSNNLRNVLRSATADAHNQLDRVMSACSLTSLDGYCRFLQINAAALFPTEQALEDNAVFDLIPDWLSRRRSSAIELDLTKLEIAATPLPKRFADLTAYEMLGALYVLEGSRLGARYLLRTVQASSDPQVRDATAFLRHGSGQRLWQDFLHVLETQDPSPQDQNDAVFAARETFAQFLLAANRA